MYTHDKLYIISRDTFYAILSQFQTNTLRMIVGALSLVRILEFAL